MPVRAKVVYSTIVLLAALALVGGGVMLHLHQEAQKARSIEGQDDVFQLATIAGTKQNIPNSLRQKLVGLEGYTVVSARGYTARYYLVWRESININESALLVLKSESNDYIHIIVEPLGGEDEGLAVSLVWRRNGSVSNSNEQTKVYQEVERLRRELGSFMETQK